MVIDVEAKLAGGDPNILLVAHTITGQRVPLQLAELQVFTTVRLGFTPLLPTFPCFGAITIALMGRPFVDFSLKIVAGDLMAAPGARTPSTWAPMTATNRIESNSGIESNSLNLKRRTIAC